MKRRNRISNRIFELLTILIFCLTIVVFGILFFALPKKGYSNFEKRGLEKFPKFSVEALIKGTYTDSITKYVSDNFAFRENFVKLSGSLESVRGIRPGNVKIYSLDNSSNKIAQCIDEPLKKVRKSLPGVKILSLGQENVVDFNEVVENSDIYNNLKEEEIKGEQVGSLYVFNDTALEIFYGNESCCIDYANIVSTYKDLMPENVKVYSMVVPTHFEFALPKSEKDIGTKQKPFIDKIYESVNPSVITVDAYSKIKADYLAGNYMYFRTDHHWTARGAYSAYLAFAKSANFSPTPLSDFEERMVDEFLGTFYPASKYDKNLGDNPDFIKFYAPTNNIEVIDTIYENGNIKTVKGALVYKSVSHISDGYLVFMNGDKPLVTVTTDAGTGRSILIFKESYGNAFIPFLTQNFDTIYIADIRSFPYNAVDFAIQKGVTDVLFINNIMTSCSPPRISNYLSLMNK